MTLKEKVLKTEPKKISPAEKGGVVGCPIHYDYLHCYLFDCSQGCDKCWAREYKEPVESETAPKPAPKDEFKGLLRRR